MADIFISYARQDREKVEPLATALAEKGFSVWWDRRIDAGSEFAKDIERELEAAKAVIVVWSAASAESPWVRDEASYARKRGKLIPIRIDDREPPLGFQQYHAIDLSRWRGGKTEETFSMLAASVKRRIEGEDSPLESMISDAAAKKVSRFSMTAQNRIWFSVAAAVVILISAVSFLALRIQPATPAATPQRFASLAVLPFANLSNDPEQTHLASAMHDAMIGELAQLDALRVISRTSTLRYSDTSKSVSQIAEELGVDAIVEASVLQLDGNLRVQVQLIQAEPEETHLLSESFDARLENVLEVQENIVRKITDLIGAKLSPHDQAKLDDARAIDPEVYQLYATGQAFINDQTVPGFERGVAYLKQALEKSPNNPMILTGLALAHSNLSHMPLPPDPSFRQARSYAAKALVLDNDQAGAHLAMAEIQSYNEWNLPAAVQSFEQALALDPNSARAHQHYAWALDALGKYEEADAAFKRAIDLDPLEPLYWSWYGWWLMDQGRFDEAMSQTEKAKAIFPLYPIAHFVSAGVHLARGEPEAAIPILEDTVERFPGTFEWALGAAYAAAGRRDEAEAIIAAHPDNTAAHAWVRANTLCKLGDDERALDAFSISVRERNSMIPWAHRSYFCPELKGDERFRFLTSVVNRES